jgi:hypothetical protein
MEQISIQKLPFREKIDEENTNELKCTSGDHFKRQSGVSFGHYAQWPLAIVRKLTKLNFKWKIRIFKFM